MSLYLLTRGSYSDYGVCALVRRSKPITDEEWAAAYNQADREYWESLEKKRAEFVARVGYQGPESGSAFSREWTDSPEYKTLGGLNSRYGRAARLLKATLVEYAEAWCDV